METSWSINIRDTAESIVSRGRSWSRGRRRQSQRDRSPSAVSTTSRASGRSMESIGAVELLSKVQSGKDNTKYHNTTPSHGVATSWMNDVTNSAGNKITALHEETLHQQDQYYRHNHRAKSMPHKQKRQQHLQRQNRLSSTHDYDVDKATKATSPKITPSLSLPALPPPKMQMEPLSRDKIASLKPINRNSSRRRRSTSGGSFTNVDRRGQYRVIPRQTSGTEFHIGDKMQSVSLGDENRNSGRMQSISLLGDDERINEEKNKKNKKIEKKPEDNYPGSRFSVSDLKEFMAKSLDSSPAGEVEKISKKTTNSNRRSSGKTTAKSRSDSLKMLFGLGDEDETDNDGGVSLRKRRSSATSQFSKSTASSGIMSFFNGLEDEEVDDDHSFRNNTSSNARKSSKEDVCDDQTLNRIPSWKSLIDGLAEEEVPDDVPSSAERTSRTSISSTSIYPQQKAIVTVADRLKRETSSSKDRMPSTYNDTESLKLWIDGLEGKDETDHDDNKGNNETDHDDNNKTTNNIGTKFDVNTTANVSSLSSIGPTSIKGESSLDLINGKVCSSKNNLELAKKEIRLSKKVQNEKHQKNITHDRMIGNEKKLNSGEESKGGLFGLHQLVGETTSLDEEALDINKSFWNKSGHKRRSTTPFSKPLENGCHLRSDDHGNSTCDSESANGEPQCRTGVENNPSFATSVQHEEPQSWWSKTRASLFTGLAQEEC